MAENKLTISIGSKFDGKGHTDAIEAGKKLKNQINEANEASKNFASSSKTHMADIKAGWDLACQGIKAAWGVVSTSLKSAFKFETQTTQFKTLIGSIDEAKAHMQMLKELGDTPPFSLDEFAKASRELMVMSDKALGGKKSLEMIGDAAAATGRPLGDVAHSVGRLYKELEDGEPISRTAKQLVNMGIITPEVASKMQELQDNGKDASEVWEELENGMSKYNGAMQETLDTGDGLIGAIGSKWDNVVRTFGQHLAEEGKGGLQQVLNSLDELEKSQALEQFGESCGRVMANVASGFDTVIGLASKLLGLFADMGDASVSFGSKIGGALGGIMQGMSNWWNSENKSFDSFAKAFVHGAEDGWAVGEDLNKQDKQIRTMKQQEKKQEQKVQETKQFQERRPSGTKKVNQEKKNNSEQKKIEDAQKAARKVFEDYKKEQKKKLEDEIASRKDLGSKQIAEINKQIADIDRQVAEADNENDRLRKGMDTDAKNSGFKGGYKYRTDENGDLLYTEDRWRADRMAGRAKRDSDNAKRIQDRQDKKGEAEYEDMQNNPNRYSDKQKDRINKEKEWRDQRKNKEEADSKKKALEDQKDAIQQQIGQDVAEIKQKIEDLMGVK